MKECTINGCNETTLVYSGVDAFILGVPTETVCYTHAEFYAEALRRNESELVSGAK